jgi:hypothetical protein
MTDEGKNARRACAQHLLLDFPDAVVAHPFETFEDLGPYDSLHHAWRAVLDAADRLQHGH